jgi:hypothetical protein
LKYRISASRSNRWPEYEARAADMGNAYRVLVRKPEEGNYLEDLGVEYT